MHSWDIVGYVYRADIYCPTCAMKEFGEANPLVNNRVLLPAFLTAEEYFDKVAEWLGVNREDEHTFDSDDFPKIVFADSVEDEEFCGRCHDSLI